MQRYRRQIILPEIGEKGQEKLRQSKVLIIGLGGLGSPTALYLAAAGVGTLGLADFDQVEESNLNRQIIHTTDDIGKDKVLSAKKKITALNPEVNIKTYVEKLDLSNIEKIIQEYDFVIEATDNIESKFIINDLCVKYKKPFSHAGIDGFKGQTLTVVPGSACLRGFFEGMPFGAVKDKGKDKNEGGEIGVLGSVPGVLGAIQATEAIKFIIQRGELLLNQLLVVDLLNMEFKKIKFNKNKERDD